MRSSRTWHRVIAVVMALTVVAWPVSVLAHLDPPGPPVILAEAKLTRIQFYQDWDDFGNAEMLVTVAVAHVGHDAKTKVYNDPDFDFDNGMEWAFDEVVYDHEECTPRNDLTVMVQIVEVDSTEGEQLSISLASALAGMGAGIATGAATGAFAGPAGAIGGAVVGLGISLMPLLNGNDDLGFGTGTLPENEEISFETIPASNPGATPMSAESKVFVRGRTSLLLTMPGCNLPPQAHYMTPDERTDAIYTHIQEMMERSQQIQAEPGNPAGLTESQVLDIRRTWVSTAVGLAELAAGAELEEVAQLEGAELAMELYLTGRELATEDPAGAVALYGQAFLRAAEARDQGITAAVAMRPPLQVSMTGNFFATRPNRTVEVIAAVLGADGPAEVQVVGLPSNVEVAISQQTEGVPVYTVRMALGDTPLGTYDFSVMAATANGITATGATIVVNANPDPYRNGVLVPAMSEGGVTTALIDPAQAQAFMDAASSYRLRLPAGTVNVAAGITAQARVVELTAEALRVALTGFQLPAGMRSLERAFGVDVEVSGSPVTAFAKPALLFYDLASAALPAGVDLDKVGFFRLGADGALTYAGGQIAGGLVRTAIPGPGLYLLAEWTPSFSDMSSHWAKADVELMASKQVVRGLPDGRFDPEGGVTRAQFAAMLVRALQLAPQIAADSFSDVQPGDWFYADVNTAVAHGLVLGHGDGTFGPNTPVTREQSATMLARALRISKKALPLSPQEVEEELAVYADGDQVSSWAGADLALVIQQGLMRGKTATTLAPQDGASRAEAAVLTARFWRR